MLREVPDSQGLQRSAKCLYYTNEQVGVFVGRTCQFASRHLHFESARCTRIATEKWVTTLKSFFEFSQLHMIVDHITFWKIDSKIIILLHDFLDQLLKKPTCSSLPQRSFHQYRKIALSSRAQTMSEPPHEFKNTHHDSISDSRRDKIKGIAIGIGFCLAFKLFSIYRHRK